MVSVLYYIYSDLVRFYTTTILLGITIEYMVGDECHNTVYKYPIKYKSKCFIFFFTENKYRIDLINIMVIAWVSDKYIIIFL